MDRWTDPWANTPEARAWEPLLQELRFDYRNNVQPVAESAKHADTYRPLVEKFWFHMTNSANSDGRWPPPPAHTCPFNRQWVLDEIEATRKALTDLKNAIAPHAAELETLEKEKDTDDTFGYTVKFTDKDLTKVADLNIYELQHAVYVAFGQYDKEETKAAGQQLLAAIFDEFERRGITHYVRPPASK